MERKAWLLDAARALHLELVLQFAHGYWQIAHRARGAGAWTSPCAIRTAGGELATQDGCCGLLVQDGLVEHGGFLRTCARNRQRIEH